MDEPLKPLLKSKFDFTAAQHLLNRAGFGGTPAQVRALAELGLEGAVALLLDAPREATPAADADFRGDILRDDTPEEREAIRRARAAGDEDAIARFQQARQMRERGDRDQLAAMQKWWLSRMIETPRPLEEKLTLFWHGHFATGYRTIENSWHMLQQNRMLRDSCVGNFERLARQIISDPAMLKYLDNDENRKRSPNENLARELLELFTLGEGNGYSERDIKDGARALTGRTFRGNDYFFDPSQFDGATKQLFGRNGNFNGDDFVTMILEHRQCSQFIAFKLYRFFVNDAPTLSSAGKNAITALAKNIREHNYDLRKALRALFQSQHFYASENRLAIVKSPTQLMVQTIRSLSTPPREMKSLVDAGDLMGQQLFQPPSVKGWDGGRSWINTATLFVRQNIVVYLVTGRRPQGFDWSPSEMHYDSSHLFEHLRDAQGTLDSREAVRHIAAFALGGSVEPERLAQLDGFLEGLGGTITDDRVKALLCLVGAMPEYQLC